MNEQDIINELQVKLNNALSNIMVLLDSQSSKQEEYHALLMENNFLIEENEQLKKTIEELKPYKEIAENLMKIHLDKKE